jgi:hypothetical protein
MTVGITDHALVRWLERTGALDTERLRALLSGSLDRASRAADSIGANKYLILADGLVYLVENNTLVTVMVDDGRHASALAPDRDDGRAQ